MKKAIELIGVVLGSALFGVILALVLSGISSSGVLGMEITHTFFGIAFVLSILIAPIAAWFICSSIKISALCLALTAIIVGGSLWRLDSWLIKKKAEQDAANRPPVPLVHMIPPLPSIPIAKTPMSRLSPRRAKPQQDNSVHVEGGSTIDQHSSGDCSPNMVGGANTVNCVPPQRNLTKEECSTLQDAFRGQIFKVYIGSLMRVPDAFEYASQIHECLKQTSLSVVPGVGSNSYDRPLQGLLVNFHGVEVVSGSDLSIPVDSPQGVTLAALRHAHFQYIVHSDPNMEEGAVQVIVGDSNTKQP